MVVAFSDDESTVFETKVQLTTDDASVKIDIQGNLTMAEHLARSSFMLTSLKFKVFV